MLHNCRCLKILTFAAMTSYVLASQAHAFIAFPPITTFSIAMVVLNFGYFAFSFSGSIIFQGWYISRKLGIGFKNSSIQAFRVKLFFILYALPVLILSDTLGTTIIFAIDKLPLPNGFQLNVWFVGLLYFAAGLFVLTSITSIVEIHLLSKKWKEISLNRLRSAIAIANLLIFGYALVAIVIAKKIME